MSSNVPSEVKAAGRRNARIALICVVVFAGMVGAAYAAVPLYRAFCQITGFGGTVRQADAAPTTVLDRTLTIRFDANVRDMPWDFAADQVSQEVKIGDTGLAFFHVTNHSDRPVTAQASYNVVATQAGAYFQKLECFCFTEQTVAAGETVKFPVVYFVDPEYASDPETRGGEEITLSYTFFPMPGVGTEAKTEQRAQAPSPLG